MKLFRKVMSGLLAGSLILSLVACGAGSGATETGDPSGNGAVGTSSASGDEIVVNVSDNVTLSLFGRPTPYSILGEYDRCGQGLYGGGPMDSHCTWRSLDDGCYGLQLPG